MYEFSNDRPELMNGERFADYVRLVEEFFHTQGSEDQIKVDAISFEEDRRLFPYTLNVIFYEGKVIGGTDILPCTINQTQRFLGHKLSEPELLEEVRRDFASGRLDYSKCNAIYLVSALLLLEHSGKGLALKAMADSIKRINIKDPTLFCWTYTEDGLRWAEKLAKTTGFQVLYRAN